MTKPKIKFCFDYFTLTRDTAHLHVADSASQENKNIISGDTKTTITKCCNHKNVLYLNLC